MTNASESHRPMRPSPLARHLRQVAATALIALTGGAVGYFSADLALLPTAELLDWPALAAAFLAAYVLAITIHELGHALAGRLVGFRLFQIAVGPVMMYVTRRGPVVRLRRTAAMFGGMCVSAPLDDHDLRRRDAVMIAGGPLANLLTALAVFVGLAVIGETGRSPLSDTFLRMLGIVSALAGAVSLVPLRLGGLTSDGEQLRRLAAGGAGAGRAMAIRMMYGALLADIRPRELEAAVVRRAAGTPDGSVEDVMGCFMAFTWALDRGEAEEAGAYLDRAMAGLEQMPPVTRGGMLIEAAAFTALHRRDAASARDLLERGRGGQVERHDLLRAEAAVLLAEGDAAGARRLAEEGLRALERARHVQSRAIDEAWLREVVALSVERMGGAG